MRPSVLICILLIVVSSKSSSPQEQMQHNNVRQAAVSGQFYSADSTTLMSQLGELFAQALPLSEKNVIAVVSPHAAYVYSGTVAATTFMQIDPDKEYDDIFIIGSSHSVSFDAASVYCSGDFITPLGIVQVDTTLCRQLVQRNNCLRDYPDAHWFEHSLEVEIPFLQYRLKKPFKIVPVIIGTGSISTCKQIASVFKPFISSNNLFIISTDLSHYANYADAIVADRISVNGIVSNNSGSLLEAIRTNSSSGIDNLVTSMCGWSSVLTLLYMTEDIPDINVRQLMYMNSGDSPLGDSSRVVGYSSIVFCKDFTEMAEKEFEITEMDKDKLLKVARLTLDTYIEDGKIPEIDTTNFGEGSKLKCGAFVTLKINGNLRGCIGRFTSPLPLYKVVQEMTIASSSQDHRFEKVKSEELKDIDIEISVLSPMKKISSIDEIVMGTHGIYLNKDGLSGTFLPQVAEETGWSKEEFLGHCARDKAGLGWDGWKNAEIYIYSAVIFGEKEN